MGEGRETLESGERATTERRDATLADEANRDSAVGSSPGLDLASACLHPSALPSSLFRPTLPA